jgi:outer membrane receptor protein involved in Fe transport
LEESFGIGGFGIIPNPDLRAEENRAFEAGIEQQLFGRKASVTATYFNNRFRNRIDFTFDPSTFEGQYVNVNSALAHGAELALNVRASRDLEVQGGYVYTSTEILKFADDVFACAMGRNTGWKLYWETGRLGFSGTGASGDTYGRIRAC